MIVAMLVASLWQGAVFAAAAAIAARCVPRQNASTRYALWFLALLAIAIVPPLTCFVHLPLGTLSELSRSPASASVSVWLVPLDAAAAHPELPLALFVTIAWAAGTALCLLRLAVSYVRITRIRTAAKAISAGVLISEDVSIPVAAGFRSPVVVVPTALHEALTAEEIAGIIAHERAHIQRGDIFANLVQRLVQALLFFNPWVHLAARIATAEREAACDDLAIHGMDNSEHYASALAHAAKIIGGRHEPLMAPGAFTSPHAVVARIRRVVECRARPQITPNYYAIGGTMILFAAIALALQSLSPASASTMPAASSQYKTPALVAANICEKMYADASITKAVAPKEVKGLHGTLEGTARVTIAPSGAVTEVHLVHSSGNTAVDDAIVNAATSSTYSPKIANCKPVQGTYLFRVRMAPSNG